MAWFEKKKLILTARASLGLELCRVYARESETQKRNTRLGRRRHWAKYELANVTWEDKFVPPQRKNVKNARGKDLFCEFSCVRWCFFLPALNIHQAPENLSRTLTCEWTSRIRVPIKVHFCAYRICHCHRSIKSDRICQDKKELLRLISTLGGAEREHFSLY